MSPHRPLVMDQQHSDPNLVTVKVTLPGPEGENIVRKFKVSIAKLHKDVIHKTVASL